MSKDENSGLGNLYEDKNENKNESKQNKNKELMEMIRITRKFERSTFY